MIGIETEYGIYVAGKGAQDLVAEATHLVKMMPGKVATGWDYGQEHPRRDMRGFTVNQLSIDPNDAQFERSDAPHSTTAEMRSDRILPNGARLYNDHGHPEYSTPECVGLRSLVAHDRAGERIMQRCAQERMKRASGNLVALYKNNTDFHGASYGCHESFLVNRNLPFDDLLQGILPFFVTRQIFAGAGKVGVEQSTANDVPYQLSQRADFFTTLASVDTLYNRPIVNTRDEPHSDARRYRRFHVICGDANLMETATFLKIGSTLLVLRLLESGWRPDNLALRDPVDAIKRVSRDQSLKWIIEREKGGTIGAVDLQRGYMSAAKAQFAGLSEETDAVLELWQEILDRLESDPLSLYDTLDWAAKRSLIEEFRAAEGLDWNDPTLQSIDLEYHNVDPEAGLYYALEQEDRVRRIVTDTEIADAVRTPPQDSPRPIIRGTAVAKFSEAMRNTTWSRFSLDDGRQTTTIRLNGLEEIDAALLRETLGTTESPAAFAGALNLLMSEAMQDEDSALENPPTIAI